MSLFTGKESFLPDYASYNWTGAPSNYDLSTNAALGGDAHTENLNKWYQSGDQAYLIVASALVWIMVPGLGFLYAGLVRRKSALHMILACMGCLSVTSVQWYLWGYSLAFSPTTANGFIGDLSNFGLMNTLAAPSVGSPLIPSLLYAFFQMQFCAVTAAIIIGAVAERGRLIPAMVFTFIWATIIYCPMVYWVWNPNGWAYKYGVLDFAGGGPIEICSGMSALAYSWILGPRRESLMTDFRRHSVAFIFLGTALLWFGWLGFNGATSFGANLRATMACWNTHLAATFAAISWILLDWRLERKWSMVGWCSGTICGLIMSTSSAGLITAWGSVIMGIVTGIVCNYAGKVKTLLRIDDSMDVFAQHGVGGIIGLLANAFFASDVIISLDGVNVGLQNPTTGTLQGGWINHNYRQLYIQLAYIVVCCAYSFTVTALVAFLINLIPGLQLRVSEEAERNGMDDSELGEFTFDSVETGRETIWRRGTRSEELKFARLHKSNPIDRNPKPFSF
ncbi:hypothetical protein OIDMADRAFT_42507 [Oidiodendron maius Zn]|uniref:Ammonium transporter n=1 Tax=Oidiodendron maius (strain Zn) TaxID=913774 RepID=A0A0C3HC01_OIDMZ|nr:hypothetical protein OIDMADRAFT_42507 [Oidiodendron maius Zn]